MKCVVSGRIEFLDFTRAIAIIGILLCHSSLAIGEGIGRYLGCCFNTVFFLISAILMGCKWSNNNYKPFNARTFLIHRLLRIYSSLIPFLFGIVILCILKNIDFAVHDIILDSIGLGWFGSLPGCGHCWFVTGILICYIMFLIMSYKNRLRKISFRKIYLSIIMVVVLSSIMNANYLPGYFFLILFLCAVCFLYANDIICIITSKFSIMNCWMIWIIVNLPAVIAFHFNIFEYYRAIAYLGAVLCGCTWLLLLCRLKPHEGKIINFISMLSYELYLVHHPLCLGPFSIFELRPWLLATIIMMFFSLVFAIILNKISGLINHKIMSIIEK